MSSTLTCLHSAVDSADLNSMMRVTTTTTTDTTAPATASSAVSLPSQADLGPKVTKKLATEKHVPVPQPWGGLHRQLTVGLTELASAPEIAIAPAVVRFAAPAPEPEPEVRRAAAPEMLPAHELVRQHRLSRDDRDTVDSGLSVHSWSGISASLEAEYGGPQAVSSPAAARPAVAAKPVASAPAVRSAPAAALRPPRTLAATTAAAQPNAWLGLSNELTTEFMCPSPSPPARRRAPKRFEPPMDAADKENASNEVAELTSEMLISAKAPPATSFGYSDLSPLAILGH